MASDDLDMDMEDDRWLQDSPPRLSEAFSKPLNKRSKALNIDDLLKDHLKERDKKLERETKRMKISPYDSDSEDSCDDFKRKTRKEQHFEELVEACEKQVHAGGATIEVPKWGEKLFGLQRQELGNIQQVMPKGPIVESLFAASEQVIEKFPVQDKAGPTTEVLMTELLRSGWLSALSVKLDDEIFHWILNTMLYSIDNNLGKSACNFLCHFLQNSKDKKGYRLVPSYESVLRILEAYGYLGSTVSNNEITDASLEPEGPPHNLESLLRFLSVAFRTRHTQQVYSVKEAESLLVLVATLSLDRHLLCIGISIQDCLSAIIRSFTEDEWSSSCDNIAVSMTRADRSLVNCLRLTCSLHSTERRMKDLQRSVALYFVSKITTEKVVGGSVWELLSIFQTVDLKKGVDFVSLYHQLSLADIWLWSNSLLKFGSPELESWLLFLKSCSYQISSTDWRPYASKVRNRAAYLLQVYQGSREEGDYEDS